MKHRIVSISRVIATVAFLCGIVAKAQVRQADQDLQNLFVRMASTSPDNCGSVQSDPAGEEKIERAILQAVEDRALEELNAKAAKPEAAKGILIQTLEPLEKMSEEAEIAWPKENRMHVEIVEMLPAIVIKVTYRTQSHFRAFGRNQSLEEGKSSLWRHLGEDHWDDYSWTAWSRLELFPLHRGPLGAVHFLVSMAGGGCAGSYSQRYSIEEWNPEGDPSLSEVMSQDGAEGLDEVPEQPPTNEVPFPTVGVLKITEAKITLPYCQFTQLDTWDNPSLCMVDTYAVSEDMIRFVGRRYNRPDLLPVAKALEYAKAHDLPAMRAYCASNAVAKKIMNEGYGFEYELETVPLSSKRERVHSRDSGRSGFVVAKRGGRWLVISFDSSAP